MNFKNHCTWFRSQIQIKLIINKLFSVNKKLFSRFTFPKHMKCHPVVFILLQLTWKLGKVQFLVFIFWNEGAIFWKSWRKNYKSDNFPVLLQLAIFFLLFNVELPTTSNSETKKTQPIMDNGSDDNVNSKIWAYEISPNLSHFTRKLQNVQCFFSL